MNGERLSHTTQFGHRVALGFLAADASPIAATPQAEAMAALRQLVGTATCDDDSQCRTVAIGQRACGGPDLCLAWSVKHADPQALQRAVAHYNAAQTAGRPLGGRFSICEFINDPGAVCLPAGAGTSIEVKTCQVRPKRGHRIRRANHVSAATI